MREIIEEISSSELAPALEANMIKYWATYGSAPQRKLYEGSDFIQFTTGIPYSLFNSVFRAKLSPDEIDTGITTVIHSVASDNTPLSWYVGPTSLPIDLGEHLLRRGFVAGGEMPVMAIELDKVPKIQQLSNFIIKQVEDNEQLLAWAHVVATGFGLPEEVCAPFIDLELSLGILPQSSARRYLGYQNEIPVSTSELVFDAGVAGIYAVTTLPEARRQGFGASMTSFPLHEALANGYKIGTLQASSMGHPVYRKLGFHDVYNFEIYEWPGSQGGGMHEDRD